MKRKFAWLMLPVVLYALAWGAKWRADHPPVTKWDLRVRSLIAEASLRVTHHPNASSKQRAKIFKFSGKEEKEFLDCFHLSQQVSRASGVAVGRNGVLDILRGPDKPPKNGQTYASIVISLDHRAGQVNVSESGNSKVYDLHPATTKRWLELLLNNPRFGPELRQRIR